MKTKLVPGDMMTGRGWLRGLGYDEANGYVQTIKIQDLWPDAPIAIFVGFESPESTKTIKIVWTDSGAVVGHNADLMVKIDIKDYK
jgi:hypothetical protein